MMVRLRRLKVVRVIVITVFSVRFPLLRLVLFALLALDLNDVCVFYRRH
jgi:hypothetical protein